MLIPATVDLKACVKQLSYNFLKQFTSENFIQVNYSNKFSFLKADLHKKIIKKI